MPKLKLSPFEVQARKQQIFDLYVVSVHAFLTSNLTLKSKGNLRHAVLQYVDRRHGIKHTHPMDPAGTFRFHLAQLILNLRRSQNVFVEHSSYISAFVSNAFLTDQQFVPVGGWDSFVDQKPKRHAPDLILAWAKVLDDGLDNYEGSDFEVESCAQLLDRYWGFDVTGKPARDDIFPFHRQWLQQRAPKEYAALKKAIGL